MKELNFETATENQFQEAINCLVSPQIEHKVINDAACQTTDELLILEDANHLKCIQTNFEFFKLQILTFKECLSGLFKNFEDVEKEKEKTKE